MEDLSIDTLEEAIREEHGCEARHLETVYFSETFRGETVWQGDVHVFALKGHSTAARCYAWNRRAGATGGRPYAATLHRGRITSPQAAVREAILRGDDH